MRGTRRGLGSCLTPIEAVRRQLGAVGLAYAVTATAVASGNLIVLAFGFVALGVGLAVPYALAPRLALSVLAPTQAGQGSGIVNAATFLGGSVGVAIGAIAFTMVGFNGVLAMIALAGAVGAGLSRNIQEASQTDCC